MRLFQGPACWTLGTWRLLSDPIMMRDLVMRFFELSREAQKTPRGTLVQCHVGRVREYLGSFRTTYRICGMAEQCWTREMDARS